MSDDVLHAYERVLIQEPRNVYLFLYVARFADANHLQVGFGTETKSGLQRAHIAGPQVHEAHTGLFANWLRRTAVIDLQEEAIPGKAHPFSSTMMVDLPVKLQEETRLPLSAGRYMPMVNWPEITRDIVARLGDAIERVHIKAWGHPKDWDVRHHELHDGRFVWMAYDHDIRKIRIGLGCYAENNERQYGSHHTYAVDKAHAAPFAARHFHYVDLPIQFIGLPARWPSALSVFLVGEEKQAFATSFLKYADEIWPGEVAR